MSFAIRQTFSRQNLAFNNNNAGVQVEEKSNPIHDPRNNPRQEIGLGLELGIGQGNSELRRMMNLVDDDEEDVELKMPDLAAEYRRQVNNVAREENGEQKRDDVEDERIREEKEKEEKNKNLLKSGYPARASMIRGFVHRKGGQSGAIHRTPLGMVDAF